MEKSKCQGIHSRQHKVNLCQFTCQACNWYVRKAAIDALSVHVHDDVLLHECTEHFAVYFRSEGVAIVETRIEDTPTTEH